MDHLALSEIVLSSPFSVTQTNVAFASASTCFEIIAELEIQESGSYLLRRLVNRVPLAVYYAVESFAS